MSEICKRVERCLQDGCSDYWHVVEEDENTINAYYINDYRFTLNKSEDGDWSVSGKEIDLTMAYNLAIVLGANY